MNHYIVMFLLSWLVCPFFLSRAYAQTCRVSIGGSDKGEISYIEVFEYDYVETKPEFPGGGQCMLNYVNNNRHYPQNAYKAGIEGRVTCSFVVNCDGSITNISVIKGVEKTLDCEAGRILSQMPNWSPGKIGGHCVPVRVVYAVPFRK